MAQDTTLLVSGAGGQLGRRVVELLIEAKKGRVIATTRDPAKLADLAAKGAEVRKADFDDPATLEAAFRGAERALLISTAAMDARGHRRRQHEAAVKAAERAGVRHVLYTSGPAARPSRESSLLDDHFWTEHAIFASKMSWTILRHNIYTDGTLMTVARALASGQIFSAAEDGGRSYVTREDCARADAAALASESTECAILDITGPEAVTQDKLAAIASELTGKAIKHVRVSPDAIRQGLAGAGLPPLLVDGIVGFDIDARQGYHAIVTSAVKDLTGRGPPTGGAGV
jgi:NAD(P)H dehydrogenase (quinone)